MKLLRLLVCALVLSSCAFRDKVDTPFAGDPRDPIIQPSPDNPDPNAIVETDYCRRDAAGSFAESAPLMESSKEGGTPWAQGGGCVLMNIREVWARLHNQPAMKWDDAHEFSWSLEDRNRDGFSHIYDVNYVVKSIITVRWNMKWFHGVFYGDFAHPRAITINYQKVSGADQIKFWKGGVLLQRVSNDVTSVAARNELRSASTIDKDLSSTIGSVNEIIHKARTVAPDWNNLGNP